MPPKTRSQSRLEQKGSSRKGQITVPMKKTKSSTTKKQSTQTKRSSSERKVKEHSKERSMFSGKKKSSTKASKKLEPAVNPSNDDESTSVKSMSSKTKRKTTVSVPKPMKSKKSSKASSTKDTTPSTTTSESSKASSLPKVSKTSSFLSSVYNKLVAPASTATKEATERLQSEMKKIFASKPEKDGYCIEPNEDNILHWTVRLFGFEKDSELAQGLERYAKQTGNTAEVILEITFPPDYPKKPPFIRVVRPRMQQYTGHITIGGSLCIQDLTMSGWNPSNELSTFIIQMRFLLIQGGAIVDMDHLWDYTESEAKEAFTRVARQHGWVVK